MCVKGHKRYLERPEEATAAVTRHNEAGLEEVGELVGWGQMSVFFWKLEGGRVETALQVWCVVTVNTGRSQNLGCFVVVTSNTFCFVFDFSGIFKEIVNSFTNPSLQSEIRCL